jgi:hypothetical protein
MEQDGLSMPAVVETSPTPIMIRKANSLIVSKYKSSLLENVLVSIGLSRMYMAEDGKIKAHIYPREIYRITGTNKEDRNLYTRLERVAFSITGHSMLVENGRNFKVFNLIDMADYTNGVFTLTFHDEAKPYITNLNTHFTTLNLLTLASFDSNMTFRLYEILLKDAFHIPPESGAYYEVTYNISELRFMLSVANIEEDRVQKELAKYRKKENIDWDRLYSLCIEKKHPKWNNFREHVIEKAKAELEDKADLRFEYEPIRQGREGFKQIKFRIYYNVPKNPIPDYSAREKALYNQEGHQYDFYEINHHEIFEKYLGHNGLTANDLKILLNDAAENEELVEQSINMADKKERLENYMGWLRACIQRNFESPTRVMKGSADFAEMYDKNNGYMKEAMKNTSGFKSDLWERIKGFEEFEEFLEYCCMSLEQLEILFTPESCVDAYTDYLKKNGKSIRAGLHFGEAIHEDPAGEYDGRQTEGKGGPL